MNILVRRLAGTLAVVCILYGLSELSKASEPLGDRIAAQIVKRTTIASY